MTAWSSCGGPWRSVASELAVALSTTPRLTELERLAGPSAPHSATTQRGSGAAPRTLLRAEPRVGMRAPHRTRFDRIGWRCSPARNCRRVTDRSHQLMSPRPASRLNDDQLEILEPGFKIVYRFEIIEQLCRAGNDSEEPGWNGVAKPPDDADRAAALVKTYSHGPKYTVRHSQPDGNSRVSRTNRSGV